MPTKKKRHEPLQPIRVRVSTHEIARKIAARLSKQRGATMGLVDVYAMAMKDLAIRALSN